MLAKFLVNIATVCVNIANKIGSKLIEDWRCPDSSLYDVGAETSYISRRPASSSKSSVGVRSSSPRRRTGSTLNGDQEDIDDSGDGTLLSLSTPVALIIIVAVCLAALLVAVGLVSYYVAVKV